MNQVSTGKPDSNPITREKLVNFSVAAGSLWVTRHLLVGMLFYFVICQIPGIMVKADLLRCVGISLLLSMGVFLVTTGIAVLLSLAYVTYQVYKDSARFLHEQSGGPTFEWVKDPRYAVPVIFIGIGFNAVFLKAFCSFYPDLIMIDGWVSALMASCVVVLANRGLHALQRRLINLSLIDEVKKERGLN